MATQIVMDNGGDSRYNFDPANNLELLKAEQGSMNSPASVSPLQSEQLQESPT